MAIQVPRVVSIPIKDPETNEEYTIEVTPDEVQRLTTDQYFVAQKLEEAKNLALARSMAELNEEYEIVDALDPDADLNESGTIPEEEDNSECRASAFKWSHEAILLLVEEYRTNETNMKSGKISQKKLWQKIGAVLDSHGHKITGPQCQSKFSGLKKTYKNIKDHNLKSGNARKTWIYYKLMDGLLGDKPFIAPVATCSSTGKKRRQSDSEGSSASYSSIEESSENIPSKRAKFTSADKLLEGLHESARIREENKNRRFQEFMALRERSENENLGLKKRAVELLEKLVEKS